MGKNVNENKKSRAPRLIQSKSENCVKGFQGKKSEFVDDTKNRMRKNFNEFMCENKLSCKDMVDIFNPYICDSSHLCKLVSGERPVSTNLLVAMYEIYKIDIIIFMTGDLKK